MTTVADLATAGPVAVLTTTPAFEAARFMADLGIGTVLVTDPESGLVVGMLTDRDVTVRLVAKDLDANTPAGDICTPDVATVHGSDAPAVAVEIMCREAIRRVPVVDAEGCPVGILALEDLAGSDAISDGAVRDILRAVSADIRRRRISSPEPS